RAGGVGAPPFRKSEPATSREPCGCHTVRRPIEKPRRAAIVLCESNKGKEFVGRPTSFNFLLKNTPQTLTVLRQRKPVLVRRIEECAQHSPLRLILVTICGH